MWAAAMLAAALVCSASRAGASGGARSIWCTPEAVTAREAVWIQGRPLLVAPTELGLELAFVDTRRGRVRKPDLDPRPRYGRPMYIDDVSSDGRHMVGAACGAEAPCEIWTYSIGRRARRLQTGQVSYPDWNR